MVRKDSIRKRSEWSGLCPECQQPLSETKRDPTDYGARVTYVCAAAHAETEPWPHVPLLRWKEGAIHTRLSTWIVEADQTGMPRPGSLLVRCDPAPNPTTEEEATISYEDAKERLKRLYRILFDIAARRAQDTGGEIRGQ